MNRRLIRLITIMAAITLTSGSTFAQDASNHTGRTVQGEVVSLSGDRFELKTEMGVIPVTFSLKTKFQHGNAIVDQAHVTKGAQVSVFGTKLPSGELVAREVVIGSSNYHRHHGTDKETAPKTTKKKASEVPAIK